MPDGLTRTGNTISGTPTSDGYFTATITANDGNATPITETLYFSILPARPPNWITSPMGMGPYAQGDTIEINFEAESDPPGNAITYRYTGTLPPGLSFDASGAVSYTQLRAHETGRNLV